MKKERDWSVSYTISWGGVNQCPKWREQALLLMWHIRQLIASAIENEGLPFIFCWADRAPSFNLSSLRPLKFHVISFFYLWVWSMSFCSANFISFSSHPCFSLGLASLATFYPKQTLILLSGVCRHEPGQRGWGLVGCLVGLDCLCGCVASTVCIQACICVPVQCCVNIVHKSLNFT